MNAKTSLDRLQQLLPQLFIPELLEGSPFLRAKLTPEITIGLPLDCIEEVKLVSAENITPMPNMPQYVMGLTHSKGYIFWLVDLAALFNLSSPIKRSKRYEMIMIQSQEIVKILNPSMIQTTEKTMFIGCTVQQVKGTLRLLPEEIKSFEESSNFQLRPFLQGYAVKDRETISIVKF